MKCSIYYYYVRVKSHQRLRHYPISPTFLPPLPFHLLTTFYFNITFHLPLFCLGMAIFSRPALTHLVPARPVRVFPNPQRWWSGNGAIFCPRTPGRGGNRLSIFIPNPPWPTLIRTIIVNLVNPKSLIFKLKHKSTRHEIKYFLF